MIKNLCKRIFILLLITVFFGAAGLRTERTLEKRMN